MTWLADRREGGIAEVAGNERRRWESVWRKDDRGGRTGGGAGRVAAMLTNKALL